MANKKGAKENIPVDTAAPASKTLAGATRDASAAPAKTRKKAKLIKKEKSRLPRKQKKAQQKAAVAKT